jgi:hypothetical protein
VLLYVLAFTDTAVRQAAGAGALVNAEAAGIFAVCQRRRAVPAATDRMLRRQHAAVVALSRRARAVLPVRFGALVEEPELLDLMRARQDVLRQALTDVRDRIQMTVRIVGAAPRREAVRASGGRTYLEERRRNLVPVMPPQASALLEAVRPFVVRERVEPGMAGLAATVYHLIALKNVGAYVRAARRLAAPGTVVSGPWPPFAFTPQLWR